MYAVLNFSGWSGEGRRVRYSDNKANSASLAKIVNKNNKKEKGYNNDDELSFIRMFQGCSLFDSEFQICFKDVPRCSQHFSRILGKISRMFQECFKGDSRKFHRCFMQEGIKDVSRKFLKLF